MMHLQDGKQEPARRVKTSRAEIRSMFVDISSTIEDAIARIDRSGRVRVALIVDKDERLVDTISDGDIRRAILAGVELRAPVAKVLSIKGRTAHPLPLCAPVWTDEAHLIELMRNRAVRQIPLIDDNSRVVDLVTLHDLLPEAPRALQAIVMAGGFGKRLRPLTERIPKPMLPVNGRPLMELIVDQLRGNGIKQICIATHFRADSIFEHFGDGSTFGVQISYTNEISPLGTGGALGLMQRPTVPIVVMNGDIVTDIDFRAMHAFHLDHKAKMTVAVRRYEIKVPYGVVYSAGVRLRRLREKPSIGVFVNAGIYLLDPGVYDYITAGAYLDMTELIERLLRANESVVSFPVREYWLDIGQPADYERAQTESGHVRRPKDVPG